MDIYKAEEMLRLWVMRDMGRDYDLYIREDGGISVRLYTNNNQYSISVSGEDGKNRSNWYLGCTSKSLKMRAGEDWTRGNDLPDGDFSQKTWNAILRAIVQYELVDIKRYQNEKIYNDYERTINGQVCIDDADTKEFDKGVLFEVILCHWRNNNPTIDSGIYYGDMSWVDYGMDDIKEYLQYMVLKIIDTRKPKSLFDKIPQKTRVDIMNSNCNLFDKLGTEDYAVKHLLEDVFAAGYDGTEMYNYIKSKLTE